MSNVRIGPPPTHHRAPAHTPALTPNPAPARPTGPAPARNPALAPVPAPVPARETAPAAPRVLTPGALTGPLPLPRPGSAPDLWLLSGNHATDFSPLDPAEQARAAGSGAGSARSAHAAAHTALRQLLGAYTATPPASVRLIRDACPLCTGPHGRPRLSGGDGPHFSLSHAPGMTLLAFAATPVGVDIEAVPRPSTVAAISHGLHPEEQRELSELPPANRPAAFARVWVRKEAYLKGLGTGLARPLHLDYVGSLPGPAPSPDPAWTLADVPLPVSTHMAAVALRR